MGKAYDKDYRELVISKYLNGMEKIKVIDFFGIGQATFERWLYKHRRGEDLSPKRKVVIKEVKMRVSNDQLLSYITKHPESYLSEIADHFGYKIPSIWYRLNKLGITRKKNQELSREGRGKKKRVHVRDSKV